MCGFVGFWSVRAERSEAELRDALGPMTDRIRHRGPDDEGEWIDSKEGIALGFRRLAILDLSCAGHQPMLSEDGRWIILLNGEIYNFAALRSELSDLSHRFRGHSDTEVLLAAVTQWGVTETLKRANGMFAFALWDREERALHLGRDRLGEKPVYYGWSGATFFFGSELKAFRENPAFRASIDRGAVAAYMRMAYVPAPVTIYEGISKLPAATSLCLAAPSPGTPPVLAPYWSARGVAEEGAREPFEGSPDDAENRLDALLLDSVRMRMVADVPLGAFLSGGIDSSTVVGMMQALSPRPVRTFTIGFDEHGFDEAPHARRVATHLGTDHTELYVSSSEARQVIPRLPEIYDEPFADPSQIPTFLVSRLARGHVTVALSGDGGDELFAGYGRYFWGRNLWRRLAPWPTAGRRVVSGLLRVVPGWVADAMTAAVRPFLPEGRTLQSGADKARRLAEVIGAENPELLYFRMMSVWQRPAELVSGSAEPVLALGDPAQWANLAEFTHRMMYLDLVTYLPENILVKVDRASMAVSLEVRVPMLDPRVVQLAWQLPLDLKVREGQDKWLLRRVLSRYLPASLFDRPKMGFGSPIDVWLRGPLREWAESLLSESRLREEGFLSPALVRRCWSEHLSGRFNWQYRLWTVLMFQAWLERFRASERH